MSFPLKESEVVPFEPRNAEPLRTTRTSPHAKDDIDMRLLRHVSLVAALLTPLVSSAQSPADPSAQPPSTAPAPATAAPAPATASEPVAPVPSAPVLEWKAKAGKGVTASMSDESFEMNIRGRFMLRGEVIELDQEGEKVETNFMVRRARLTVAGHVFSKQVQYLMQAAFAERDFESGNVSPLYDAYITLTHLRDLNVRLGQQLVPHDRARVISSSSAQLVDRSPVVSSLQLGRDVGVQLFSDDLFGLGNVLGYQLGLFGGEGRNARGFDAGFMYTGRLQVAPFGKFEDYKEADIEREDRARLAIGLGAAYNQNTRRPQSNQGTPFSFATFNYLSLEADLIFKVAGFSFESQLMYRGADKDSVSRTDSAGMTETEHSLGAWGYFAQAGYMLNDHFEVAGRYSRLLALDDTDADYVDDIEGVGGIGHEIIGGLSWYAEGHNLKVQADYGYLFGDEMGDGAHHVRVQGQTVF